MSDVLMPRLVPAMHDGVLVRWIAPDGGAVVEGELIAEVGTGSGDVPLEAPWSGELRHLVAEGASLPVGEAIASIREADEPDEGDTGQIGMELDVAIAHEGPGVIASHQARRLADELGVDLSAITGTGPGGRIVRADVEEAATGAAVAPVHPGPLYLLPEPEPEAANAHPALPETGTPVRPAPGQAPEAPAPAVVLERDVDATEALALRDRLAEACEPGTGPSLVDLVVRAVAMALADPDGVDVGVAVHGAAPAVVPGADRLSVGAIAATTRTGADAAGEVALTVLDMSASGVDRAVPAAGGGPLLTVGRVAARALVRCGAVVAGDMLTLTLAPGSRAPHEAAALLDRVADLLERPHALVL